MKMLLASLAALSAVAVAAPAMADPPRNYGNERSYDNFHDNDGYRDHGGYHDDRYRDGDFRSDMRGNFDQRLDRLEFHLREGTRHGDLNPYEARRFWGELRNIRDMKRNFEFSRGISPREAQILDNRIDRFGFALRDELREDRYGWNDRR